MTRHDATTRQAILVVDDHELIRQSMAQVLRQAFDHAEVVEAARFDDVVALFADPAVYLAVVDLAIPGMDRPRDLEKLRRLRPDVRVVVLSGSEARGDILEALAAGVHGYIIKNERTEMVIAHIKQVLAGEVYVPPILAELPAIAANKAAAGDQRKATLDALTPRQREVLALIGEGLSNKEIGRRLTVAEGTVKMHVGTIFRSIGATNRAHAAAISLQLLSGGSS